ncbi:Golgi membrane protein 1 isoform X1 [Apis mellifera caucasica]|uniref:Golgi membrane protein 1 isoform X1 n=1 Tax=Apis mellifera TaxID=7460 RepID=A0A7M7FZC3_APIME|nr:Golgi membrane protein 1 isoform X1 [Apis mellifera]KAG6804524.1 Golgi membrane protein 1 isoform X1 [Apis mellifera caucasica]KAG9435195.1 Golgi membrane protein 1 isoform X1 [Apis mellifera carnica]|eukprot:XP_001122673.2 Golgi membrane protein 1 isoform X1 [Apis mellifera]
MGIDSMRVGGGRCPPLLVGGLLVACLMLICNWWTLSSENIELVRQIDELNEQLKISAEERDQCVTLRGNLEQRYKHAEDEVASLHVRLEQQADLKEKNDKLEDSVNRYKNDLDLLKLNISKTATLETRQEKNNFNIELNSTREKNKKLQEEIEQLKNDLDKVKSTCNLATQKKTAFIPQTTREVINKIQLDPVPESAVRISLAGQRGLKYHGIPILPKDPPGAVRLKPRFSVTMPKVQISSKLQKNDSNGDMDDNPDPEISKTGNRGTDNNVIESGRDQHTSNGRLNED